MKFKAFAGIGAKQTPNTADYPIGDIMAKTAKMLTLQRKWRMTCTEQDGGGQFFQNGLFEQGLNIADEGLFKLLVPQAFNNAPRHTVVIDNEDLLHRARALLIEHRVYPSVPRFIALEGEARNELTEREQAMASLHTLRVFQLLQEDLEQPVNMVICWTPDGAVTHEECATETTGGSGIAIALAHALNIPVFNLQREDHLARICDFINEPIPLIKR
jgi:hypothetical protein